MFRIYLRIVRLTYERVEVKKKFPSDFVPHPVVPKYREKIKKERLQPSNTREFRDQIYLKFSKKLMVLEFVYVKCIVSHQEKINDVRVYSAYKLLIINN